MAARAALPTSMGDDDHVAGLSVTIQDLSYTVASNSNKKENIKLLNGVTGYVKPGELVALMGPSGSGKTTLLDVLAGRKTTGKVDGKVRFGGQTRRATTAFVRRYTGYVEQFDTLVANMTVFEVLMYTCVLKSPVSEGAEAKRARVERAIAALALEQCRDVLVGGRSRRGVSGGQLKRANIALALVSSPKVLFLDEPTTGLDSYTANGVMSCVRALADSGITVCATIHSPTPHAFALFHRLFVMLRGEIVYFGPNDDGVVGALSSTALPSGESRLSRAEWLTDVVVQADREGRAGECAARYASSKLAAANAAETAALASEAGALASAASARAAALTRVRRATETPGLFGYLTLLRWRFRADLRDPGWVLPRIASKVVDAFVVLTLYLGVGNDPAQANNPNVVAALFMWVALPGFAAVAYTPAIVLERALYIRERSDGLYRSGTYFAFKLTEELLVAFVAAPLLAVAAFYAIQLQGSWAVFWLAYFLTTATGIALGYLVAAVSPSLDVANAALPCFVVIMLFFSGNLMLHADMPRWLAWIMWCDFLHYSWGAVTINQFQGYSPPAVLVGNEDLLELYSLKGVLGGPWAYLGVEAVFLVAFSLMAWAALAFVRHGKR